MARISDIAEGWLNYFVGGCTDTEAERARACAGCHSNVEGSYEKLMPDFSLKVVAGRKCDECGCPLSTKIRSKEAVCPLGKW